MKSPDAKLDKATLFGTTHTENTDGKTAIETHSIVHIEESTVADVRYWLYKIVDRLYDGDNEYKREELMLYNMIV